MGCVTDNNYYKTCQFEDKDIFFYFKKRCKLKEKNIKHFLYSLLSMIIICYYL